MTVFYYHCNYVLLFILLYQVFQRLVKYRPICFLALCTFVSTKLGNLLLFNLLRTHTPLGLSSFCHAYDLIMYVFFFSVTILIELY